MAGNRPLSVQSFCFREFTDNKIAVQMVLDCGLSGFEIWKGHIDFADVGSHNELIGLYRDAGVSLVSTGVNKISGNDAEDRQIFQFAKKAGCSAMSVDFPLPGLDAALASAEKLSEEFGIPVGIHNHGGRHWLGNATALRWVFGKTSTRVGLSLDTGWTLDSREDPVAWVREFGDRVHLLHLKDFTFAKNREPEEAILGEGNLDLDELAKALAETNFSGLSIIEYEGRPSDPVPEIKKCVAAIKDKLSDFYD